MSTTAVTIGDTQHHLAKAAELAEASSDILDSYSDRDDDVQERLDVAATLAALATAHATIANTLVMST